MWHAYYWDNNKINCSTKTGNMQRHKWAMTLNLRQRKRIQEEQKSHCKNKFVKITDLFVSTVARNSANCNLIGHVGCYDCMVMCM